MTNLETILPTFNDVEFDFNDVVEHTTFGYVLEDGEMAIWWDNNIPGAGVAGVVKTGPIINKCVNKYRDYVDPNTPDSPVYNQELGTCFGAVREPEQSSTYDSVFTDPPDSATYTSDDLNASNVRLTRTPIHYWNQEYAEDDPEGFDWEARPDVVEQYFGSGDSKKKNKQFIVRYYGYDGSTSTFEYDYDKVPSSVMKQFPLIFSKEEILKRIKEEALSTADK